MSEIDDIKRRAGITEDDNDGSMDALKNAHGVLYQTYISLRQGNLTGDKKYVDRVMEIIKRELDELNQFIHSKDSRY